MCPQVCHDESDSSPPIKDPGFRQMLSDVRQRRQIGAEELFRRYAPYIQTLAERYLDSDIRPKVSGSDIVQTSVFEACQGLPNFKGATEREFRFWLRRIVVNNILNEYRFWSAERRTDEREALNLNPHVSEELTNKDHSPSTKASRNEQEALVFDSLKELTDEYRMVIELRNRDGLSFGQIAARMSRSEDAARMLWARAMRTLVRRLKRPAD